MGAQSITVTITLQSGYDFRSLVPTDRFLIMCLPIDNKELTSAELIDFWKVEKNKFSINYLVKK